MDIEVIFTKTNKEIEKWNTKVDGKAKFHVLISIICNKFKADWNLAELFSSEIIVMSDKDQMGTVEDSGFKEGSKVKAFGMSPIPKAA
jgi:hypothetical protein